MTIAEALAELERISRELSHDPEAAHGVADEVLLRLAPTEVRDAYAQIVDSCNWWAFA